MYPLTPNLRNPGTALVVFGLSLSVAILTAMLSIGEATRRQAAALLPPTDRDLYSVTRWHGKAEREQWPITRDEMMAIRAVSSVLSAAASAGPQQHTVKYGRWHVTSMPMMLVDEQHYRISAQVWGANRPMDSIRAGRDFSEEDIASGAPVCLLTKGWADLLHLAKPGGVVRIDGRPFQVIGFANDPEYGKGMPYLPLTTVGKEAARPEVFLRLLVRGDQATLRRVSAELQRIFRTTDRFELGGSRDSAREAYARARREVLTLGVLGGIPLAITFFGALGISLGWVRERMRVFALLRALGATRLHLALAAVLEPVLLAALGASVGSGLGGVLTFVLRGWLGVEAAYNWHWFLAAWGVGCGAMLVPAVHIGARATLVAPADVLRA